MKVLTLNIVQEMVAGEATGPGKMNITSKNGVALSESTVWCRHPMLKIETSSVAVKNFG